MLLLHNNVQQYNCDDLKDYTRPVKQENMNLNCQQQHHFRCGLLRFGKGNVLNLYKLTAAYFWFQWMLEAQNKRIDELVERIKQQQEKLDKQNVRIRTLQNQVRILQYKI